MFSAALEIEYDVCTGPMSASMLPSVFAMFTIVFFALFSTRGEERFRDRGRHGDVYCEDFLQDVNLQDGGDIFVTEVPWPGERLLDCGIPEAMIWRWFEGVGARGYGAVKVRGTGNYYGEDQ